MAGDHILRRDFEHVLAERDADDLVEGTEDQYDTWTLGYGQGAAQPKDHATFVFTQDLDGIQKIKNNNGDEHQNRSCEHRTSPT